jgi:hypothetical protein
MRVLEPLLTEPALQEAHRGLIRKKLELFEKQRARATRIMTRSASSQSSLSAITTVRKPINPNETSEMTAIRKPIDPASERPTDVPLDKTPPGVPTEAVPKVQPKSSPLGGTRVNTRSFKPPGNDTDFGQPESTEVGTRPVPSLHSSETTVRIPPPAPVHSKDSTVLMPANARPMHMDPNDSQELAPLSDDDMPAEGDDEDPRTTSIFAVPPTPVVDQMVQPHADSSPTLVRTKAVTEDTKTPPPSPRVAVSEDTIPHPEPMPVRDSFVLPRTQNVIPTPAPGPKGLQRDRDEDSTYLLADEHFASKPPSRKAPQSTPDLKALVDRLPDDDLRRELALEVVRLREELQASRRETSISDSPSSRNERVRPESGTFHIPASQANTIVRRAAGSDRIEVHMPARDEDAADLQVLRRDSVRGKSTDSLPADRVALAQDYIEAGPGTKRSMLKPLATWLGAAAVVLLVAWLLHLGWKSISAAETADLVLTETSVGGIELGAATDDSPGLANATRDINKQVYTLKDRNWLVQYASIDGRDRVVAITLPTGGDTPPVSLIQFGSRSLRLADGAGLKQVRQQFGEPDPPFSDEMFKNQAEYSLLYKDTQGRSVLEVRYRTASPDAPLAIRLFDARANPPFPELPTAK